MQRAERGSRQSVHRKLPLQNDPGELSNRIDDRGNAGTVKELTAIARRMFDA